MLPGKKKKKKEGREGKKKTTTREVFSRGILRKEISRLAVDVFIYVFVNEATGESREEKRKKKTSR